MKYNININQKAILENDLTVIEYAILDVISTAPTWCADISINNIVYYWIARQKLAEELKAFDLKADTVYRYLKKLVVKGFLNYIKHGKKDCINLTTKAKKMFSATMSENNSSHYVGKKSENYSEKNPTYNTTISNNIIYIDFKNKFSFINEDSFNKLVTHLKSKFNKLTKVRVTNNIKKLVNNPDLFSKAVNDMIDLDYSGLFVPSSKQKQEGFNADLYAKQEGIA